MPEDHGVEQPRGLDPHSAPAVQLRAAAAESAGHAHAPYSGLRVGAALLVGSGEVFTGCNVESASYGLSMCAERVALFVAVNALGDRLGARALAVATDPQSPCPPCGACRQLLSELAPGALVLFRTSAGEAAVMVDELIPWPFELEGRPS